MSHEIFLGGKIQLCCGDSLHYLKDQSDNRFDSIVTDPPYALEFMGKQWDTGKTAFAVEFWSECLRVLKPGGHVVAFGGTRTYHRLACAIEDAGFEIRDQIGWCFGQGFPKSLNVSNSIDKKRDDLLDIERVRSWLNNQRISAGLSFGEINAKLGRATNGGGRASLWMTNPSNIQCPTWNDWIALKQIIGFGDEMDSEVVRLNDRKGEWGEAASARGSVETTGGLHGGSGNTVGRFTGRQLAPTPVLDAAIQWQGWGTALKPAWEPIALARKPLIGTVAENVLAHGTGAINVDGCRVEAADKNPAPVGQYGGSSIGPNGHSGIRNGSADGLGRWPANIIHDGSDEVIAAFPEESSVTGARTARSKSAIVDGTNWLSDNHQSREHIDSGSPARFFYSAKADSDDRLGSKHPTIKPVDLMQWLVRLVTPKGGLVLDPFAGTGTTAEACFREGMRCALVECEAEYQDDIRRRMSLILAGPDERARESIKAKMKDKPIDDGPLFSYASEA